MYEKEIKNFENYTINKDGVIKNKKTGRTLKTFVSDGRVRINLRKDLKSYSLRLHVLLTETFIGDIPDGYVVDHIDYNPLNNKLDNLQIITQRENLTKDKFRKGKTSKYPGVAISSNGQITSQIYFEKKIHYLGSFKTEEDAYEKYLEFIKENNVL